MRLDFRRRRNGMPMQIEAGAGGHAAVVADAALPVEYRDIEPRQIRPESGGPDDRLDLAGAKIESQPRGRGNLGGGEPFAADRGRPRRFGRPCVERVEQPSQLQVSQRGDVGQRAGELRNPIPDAGQPADQSHTEPAQRVEVDGSALG